MILDGAIWGQTDGVPIFFLLLAIVAIQAQRPVWAGALLGLAVMVKPQPVIFIPILLWYVLLTAGWRDLARASLAGLITILLICSPFLLPPHIQMLAYLPQHYTRTSAMSSTQRLQFLVPDRVATCLDGSMDIPDARYRLFDS